MNNIFTPTMITNIVLALLPFIATFAYYLCRLIEQRLPKNQVDMLNHFVAYAVQMVEQQYPALAGDAKKKLAEDVILGLIKSFGLPVPSLVAIDTALEATVFQLQQMPSVLASRQGAGVGQVQGTGSAQGSTPTMGVAPVTGRSLPPSSGTMGMPQGGL